MQGQFEESEGLFDSVNYVNNVTVFVKAGARLEKAAPRASGAEGSRIASSKSRRPSLRDEKRHCHKCKVAQRQSRVCVRLVRVSKSWLSLGLTQWRGRGVEFSINSAARHESKISWSKKKTQILTIGATVMKWTCFQKAPKPNCAATAIKTHWSGGTRASTLSQ
jgi:hypothetical protein